MSQSIKCKTALNSNLTTNIPSIYVCKSYDLQDWIWQNLAHDLHIELSIRRSSEIGTVKACSGHMNGLLQCIRVHILACE